MSVEAGVDRCWCTFGRKSYLKTYPSRGTPRRDNLSVDHKVVPGLAAAATARPFVPSVDQATKEHSSILKEEITGPLGNKAEAVSQTSPRQCKPCYDAGYVVVSSAWSDRPVMSTSVRCARCRPESYFAGRPYGSSPKFACAVL